MEGAGKLLPEQNIAGESVAVRDVVNLIDQVAQSDCPVLIEGESGTGKELVARCLHTRGPWKAQPFIPMNCAGVGEGVFESQFFGHVRGAFTGAEQSMLGLVRAADKGTLLLDEVGEMTLQMRAKLLRVLQDGEVLPVGTVRPEKVDTRFVRKIRAALIEKETRAGRIGSEPEAVLADNVGAESEVLKVAV